jgi:hypothetical protein
MTTVATQPAHRIHTRSLIGLDFVDDISVDATVERLLGPQAGEEREPVVFTPNVDTVVRLSANPRVSHTGCTPRATSSPTGNPSCGPAGCSDSHWDRGWRGAISSRSCGVASSLRVGLQWSSPRAKKWPIHCGPRCPRSPSTFHRSSPQRTRAPSPASFASRPMCSTVPT